MKHASADTIAALDPLLERVRSLDGLTERKPGLFSVRGRAFLHFHEDPAGPFADVRLDDDFTRFPVHSARDQDELVTTISAYLRSHTRPAP